MDITKTIQLVQRAQGGDGESLNRLFERYFRRVRTIVRARMGQRVRKWNDSGDIIQQTFISAVRGFHRFEMRNDAAFINWLARIAENEIRGVADKMDADKRNPEKDVSIEEMGAGPVNESAGFDLPSEDAAPPDVVGETEEQVILDEALMEMEEEYRELILLRDYMGHSWAEVAELTDCPTADAARMRYATARARLTVLVTRLRGRDRD